MASEAAHAETGSCPTLPAGVVTYKITAQVDYVNDSNNVLGGAIQSGTILSGTYTVDTRVVDAEPWPEKGIYYQPLVSGLGFDLQAGGHVFRSASEQAPVHVEVGNGVSGAPDDHSVSSNSNDGLSNGAYVHHIGFFLIDPEGTALVSDALTADVPLAAGFDHKSLQVAGAASDGSGWFDFSGSIISIELLNNPAPFVVSPPTATYDRHQPFALAVIFDPEVEPRPLNGFLNGQDITPYLNSTLCGPGAPNEQQRASWICYDFSPQLQTGCNQLEISVEIDGETHTQSVMYEVLGY
jgi:hypothetical protein